MDSTRTTPADTVAMTLFHSALRRDLARIRSVLGSRRLSAPRRRLLGRHIVWVVAALRWHHEGEDAELWPVLIERAPESRDVLHAMEAEHHAIDEPLARLESAGRGLAAGRTAPAQIVEILDDLEGPLLAHLAHEEDEAMQIVSRVLTTREWKDFENRAWAEGYSTTQSLRFVTWLVDGTASGRDLWRRAGVPAAAYWLALKPLSQYGRLPLVSPWAGTPAARIPPLPA